MSGETTLEEIRPGWRLAIGAGTLALGVVFFLMAISRRAGISQGFIR